MADKKMNQFTTATDGAYIYAEASNGSQVKISKDSLLNLLRNELGPILRSFMMVSTNNRTGLIIKTSIPLKQYDGIRLEVSFGCGQNGFQAEHFIVTCRIWDYIITDMRVARMNYSPTVCKLGYVYIEDDDTISFYIDTGDSNQSFSNILISITESSSRSFNNIKSVAFAEQKYVEGVHSNEAKFVIS